MWDPVCDDNLKSQTMPEQKRRLRHQGSVEGRYKSVSDKGNDAIAAIEKRRLEQSALAAAQNGGGQFSANG